MSYLDNYIPQCRTFEGSVAWMYLDTKGLVTVGVGNMLPNVAAALKLPFRVAATGELATEPAVRDDFARVTAMQAAKSPRFYYVPESPVLTQADINSLLMARLITFDAELGRAFSGWTAFPDDAKLAVLDMAFNLGTDRLLKGYPHFTGYVRAQNWAEAAEGCGRDIHDPAFDIRNAWTRRQFLRAAGVSV